MSTRRQSARARGYYGVAVYRPKTEVNVGGVVRPRVFRRRLLAVCVAIIAAGALAGGVARADPDRVAAAICRTLDENPTVEGELVAALWLVSHGMTPDQAGATIGWAVNDHCPRHLAVLDAAAAKYGRQVFA